jgi:hypothetical protein
MGFAKSSSDLAKSSMLLSAAISENYISLNNLTTKGDIKNPTPGIAPAKSN